MANKTQLKFSVGDKLEVSQVRSSIARPKDQILTLKSIGLGKIGHVTTQRLDASLLGKLKKIWHMVEVKKV
jgi:large subunit ribosomal protein L30